MRNALGLMLASVVTAVVIAGVWFWTSSPRGEVAPPQTIAARKSEPLTPAAAASVRWLVSSVRRLHFNRALKLSVLRFIRRLSFRSGLCPASPIRRRWHATCVFCRRVRFILTIKLAM